LDTRPHGPYHVRHTSGACRHRLDYGSEAGVGIGVLGEATGERGDLTLAGYAGVEPGGSFSWERTDTELSLITLILLSIVGQVKVLAVSLSI